MHDNAIVKNVLDAFEERSALDDIEMSEFLTQEKALSSKLSREEKIWLLKYVGDWDFATGNITVAENGDIVPTDQKELYQHRHAWQQPVKENDYHNCKILVAHINTGGVIANLDTLSPSFVCNCIESINQINSSVSDFFSNGIVALEKNVDVKNFLNSVYNSLRCPHPQHFKNVETCDIVLFLSANKCVAFECDNFGMNKLSDTFTIAILNSLQTERNVPLETRMNLSAFISKNMPEGKALAAELTIDAR